MDKRNGLIILCISHKKVKTLEFCMISRMIFAKTISEYAPDQIQVSVKFWLYVVYFRNM